MATTARQTKQARNNKPMQDSARRPSAWTGARASPTYSPGTPPPARPQQQTPQQNASSGFPPLGGANGASANAPDRNLQALSGLTGTTVTITLRAGTRFEGVVSSTTQREGDSPGLTLKDARDVGVPGAPLQDTFFIPAPNIASWKSGPADAHPNGDSFKTDVDITKTTLPVFGGPRHGRELQTWADDSAGLDLSSSIMGSPAAATTGHGDDVTFGAGSSGGWDQFAANERLFNVKTSFDEEAYTTRLDRSAPDFKERERKAQQIANEIMGAASSNPHIAEERTMNNIDDSGVNEEDKYGAVVRGAGAYVPPGARRGAPPNAPPAAAAGAAPAPAPAAAPVPATALAPAPPAPAVPKVSINGPDGSAQPTPATATPSSASKPPADPTGAFREFVSTEKQRLTQKRQALVKNEMDKKMAELLEFSQKFKLKQPIPEDLVPILAKDEGKQKAIRDKASKDAASTAARVIATPAQQAAAAAAAAVPPAPSAANVNPVKLDAARAKAGITPSASAKAVAGAAGASKPGTAAVAAEKKGRFAMSIQPIPPFKGKKAGPPAIGITASAANNTTDTPPLSPNSARLNANALSFKPNPRAAAFSPVAPSPSKAAESTSPKPKTESPAAPNPFFGVPSVKKNPPVSVRDDFNPFKYNKVAEASAVGAMWPYNGKRYAHMFPPVPMPPQPAPPGAGPPPPQQGPPQPQASPLMGPHPPPQMVPQPPQPGPYEEDPAAQAARAAAGTFVYAYPPYGYPGAPMMAGMPPPGPPGGYMTTPYMAPMHYPPMAPNGQPMYASPQMGQMPPPGPYMAPPPGAYPPPPNGAGPRPSMPPTPIPSHAHAHPYYQPSPQMQHAVPYPMMMAGPPPPGPGMQPHPYEQGPPAPAPMGAAGHA